MDPHNSNLYTMNTNKGNEIFGGYVRNPCAQQSPSQRQHFLPTYAVPMTNNMSQSLMYNTHQNQSMYNIMYPHQTMYRNQNTFPTNFSQDWSDACMKNGGYKEKYDKKKENCCTENVTTDIYKKNFYNYNKNCLLDSQWYYDSQKYSELPSCSQITVDNAVNNFCSPKETKNVKSVKYCSIQKLPENDPKIFSYSKQYDNNLYFNQFNKLSKEYSSCSQLTQTCNLYTSSTCLEVDKKILLEQCDVQNVCENVCDLNPNQYYPTENLDTYINVTKLHDKTDESNGNGGESDIVVEDSDEESDESEETEKEALPCLVCNINVENQSYEISSVTTFSQTKVYQKLQQIFGSLSNTSKHLCAVCMSLVNTLDNLETQLNNVKEELIQKYKANIKNSNVKIQINSLQDKSQTKNKTKGSSFVFKCRVCQKIYSFKKFYKYHMSKHKIKFICEHCGCQFSKISKLKLHLRSHKRKCTACNKIILTNTKHECVSKFICHICGKTFKTKANLKEHENFCSGALPFNCPHCPKRFPSATKMNQHIKLFHEKIYTNECKICEKGFVKKSDYNSHMLKHSNDKKFACKICKNVYKTLSNLNQHKKIHNDSLPHICTICQKGFLRKENLESHLNIHKGIKPFSCDICEKKFAAKKNLDAHIRVHKGTTKKKICSTCGKQIIHGLEEHMRIHSTVKEFECGDCSMRFLTKGALAKHVKRKHENKELDIL